YASPVRSSLVLLLPRRLPIPTLFPYTTLFRSDPSPFFGRFAGNDELPGPAAVATTSQRFFITVNYLPGGPASAGKGARSASAVRSEEHTSELQSRVDLVCRLLLEKKKR